MYLIMKSLIIHITCGKHEALKKTLDQNSLFVKYYDGWESTIRRSTQISTRYYYYDIPHDELTQMITYLYYYGKEYNTAVYGYDLEDAKQNFMNSFKYIAVLRQAIDDGYIKFRPYFRIGKEL